MSDYLDYAEIQAHIANAQRMRSEVVGEYLSAGWRALKNGLQALAGKSAAKDHDRHGPCQTA